MEFHTNNNCCLIDQVIINETQKYDVLSKENINLHNILINSKQVIIQMEHIIKNLHDVLLAERQSNLQMYIQEQTHNLQTSMMNPHQKNSNTNLKSSVSFSAKDKALLPKYNELINLVDEQRRMYEADFDLFQSLNLKLNTKLKLQLKEMHYHVSQKFEGYKLLQNDLFAIRKENIKYRKELQVTIDALNLEQKRKVEEMKNKMILQATDTAKAQAKEAVTIMKIQLEDKDKLVTKLRQDQLKIEKYVEDQEQGLYKQLKNHKQTIGELQKQLRYSENKYNLLQVHRSEKCQEIPNDIAKIRKKIKEIKNKIIIK